MTTTPNGSSINFHGRCVGQCIVINAHCMDQQNDHGYGPVPTGHNARPMQSNKYTLCFSVVLCTTVVHDHIHKQFLQWLLVYVYTVKGYR